MDRHLILYQQGLASIRRKADSIRYAEEIKAETEKRECVFAPVLIRKRLVAMTVPKLFQNTVQRIRTGIANRERVNELLTPRAPMGEPPKNNRLRRQGKVLPSVSVEVTKDGPGGDAVLVGKFLLYPDSDPNTMAARFAHVKKLTPSQQSRLALQLEENKRNAFSNLI